MSTVAERVERGAALLDARRPGWWQEINLGRLNLSSGCDCILGQIGGTLGYAATALSLGADTTAEEVRFGFEAPDVLKGRDWDDWDVEHAEYAALTAAWHDLIQQRRELAGAPA